MRPRTAVVAVAAALYSGRAAGAQSTPRFSLSLLTGTLAQAQQASVARGDAVVQELKTSERRDVAVMGVIHVDRPRAEIIGMARAAKGASIGAAHGFMRPFSMPEAVDDMAALHLTPDDIKALSKCKPDGCNLKLATPDMATLRSIVALKTPDVPQRAEDYLRRRLVDYVSAYRRDGNSALPVYGDRGNVRAGDAFASMLQDNCRLTAAAPELTQFLLDYPRVEAPGESGMLYWALDSMPRTHATTRIMQEVTYTPLADSAVTIVAAKQLYANHYFEAGLEVLAAVDDSAGRGTTVVILRHYRFDQLPRIAFIDLRGRVVDRLKDAVSRDLGLLRTAGNP